MDGQTLLATLTTAYSGAGAEAQRARQLLERLQNSAAAWDVAAMLAEHAVPADVQFFAARCLKHKITHDLAQLVPTQLAELQQFLDGLARHEAALPSIVATQLALARAALVAQTGQYETLLAAPHADLKALAVIPEMLANRSIPRVIPPSSSVSERIVQTLLPHGDYAAVGQWLEHLMRQSGATDDGSPSSTAASFITSPTFLQQLFEHWATMPEVLARVIELNASTGDAVWLETLDVHVALLMPQDTNDADTDTRALAVAAAIGELFMDRLLAREHNLRAVVAVLLAGVSSRRAADVECTLNAWDVLAERGYYPDVFSALLQRLLQSPHLRYPVHHLDADAPDDDDDDDDQCDGSLDDFREFRHVLGDTIKTCVNVLGSTKALQLVHGFYRQTPRAALTLSRRESLMFVLRTMASAVNECESEVVPLLLNVLLLDDNPAGEHLTLRYSKHLLAGAFAKWTVAQGCYWVHRLCLYLTESLESTGSPEPDRRTASSVGPRMVQAMAARSLMYIAESDVATCKELFPVGLVYERLLAVLQSFGDSNGDDDGEDSSSSLERYLMCTLGLVSAGNAKLEPYYTLLRATVLARQGAFWPSYGALLRCLIFNGRLDNDTSNVHARLVLPWLLGFLRTAQPAGLRHWGEEHLEALGASLVPIDMLVPDVVLRLYCELRFAPALALATDERCQPMVPALLERAAAVFLPDSAGDFCAACARLEGTRLVLGPVASALLLHIAADGSLSASCALELADMVHRTPALTADPNCAGPPEDGDPSARLVDAIVQTALQHWPASSVGDLGRALWRRLRRGAGEAFVARLLGRLADLLTPEEGGFYHALGLQALAETRPTGLKRWLINIGELVRRRT